MRTIIEKDALENVIDATYAIVDEATLHINEEGWHSTAVDAANIAMYDLTFPSSAFETYDGTRERPLGLNLERFDSIIDKAGSGELVDLDYNPETRKLGISYHDVSYSMALIDPDSIRQEPDIPDLDLPVEVMVTQSHLDRAITMADMVSDHIVFEFNHDNEEFVISASGDTDDFEMVLTEDVDDDFEVSEARGPAHSIFSLEYLKDMKKGIPTDHPVRVRIGEEFPIKLRFALNEGTGSVTYVLAPRIQSE